MDATKRLFTELLAPHLILPIQKEIDLGVERDLTELLRKLDEEL